MGPDIAADTSKRTNNRPKCAVCPLCSHATADCWELDKNKIKQPDNWSTLLNWHTPGSINNTEPGISGIVNNNIHHVKYYATFPTSNYWTPLDRQIKELGSSHEHATHKYVASSLGDSNSAVFDTGTTSSCGRTRDKFQPTTQRSHKIFHIPTGETTAAITQDKLFHTVCDPAKTVDMVPQL